MTPTQALAFGAMVAVICVAASQAQDGTVTLVPITYEGLKQEVHKQRGKVLLLDFWGSSCLPCMKAFPTFIELHKKYSRDGLVIITVSVDDADQKEKVNAATAFLHKVKSPFVNLLLEKPWDMAGRKLEFQTVPCYYVFDRHGKWVRFGGRPDQDVNYDELKKTVARMLNEK